MESEYWLERWRTNDTEFDQQEPSAYLVEHFPKLGLASGAHVFVPLCGKSIDMVWLRNQGFRVSGVELSKSACEAFFEEHHIPYEVIQQGDYDVFQSQGITLWCGDYFSLNGDQLGKIDGVYDRASLIALPPNMRASYASKMLELVPHSPLLLICVEYPEDQMSGPPFSVRTKEVDLLYSMKEATTLMHEKVAEIPEHFAAAGLKEAAFCVYHLR